MSIRPLENDGRDGKIYRAAAYDAVVEQGGHQCLRCVKPLYSYRILQDLRKCAGQKEKEQLDPMPESDVNWQRWHEMYREFSGPVPVDHGFDDLGSRAQWRQRVLPAVQVIMDLSGKAVIAHPEQIQLIRIRRRIHKGGLKKKMTRVDWANHPAVRKIDIRNYQSLWQ